MGQRYGNLQGADANTEPEDGIISCRRHGRGRPVRSPVWLSLPGEDARTTGRLGGMLALSSPALGVTIEGVPVVVKGVGNGLLEDAAAQSPPMQELAERARTLRRESRFRQLTSDEETELERLHAILDQPTQEELNHLREEESRDRARFQDLLDRFDQIMNALEKQSDGR